MARSGESFEPPHPRQRLALFGHERAEADFAAALAEGRLHHAWLISGPRGVGKATFAYRAARRVLGARPDATGSALASDADDPIVGRIANASHADLFTLERPYDAAKGRYKSEIPVDEARRLKAFFASTAGEGGFKVAIVDSVDEMNANAANAILKTLEEPPAKALLLLVAHAPGRALATIRSRCRSLSLSSPGEAIAAAVAQELVGVQAREAQAAARLAEGRPGEAVRIAGLDGQALDAEVCAVFAQLPDLDAARAAGLADALSTKDAEARRALFFDRLRACARRRARLAIEEPGAEAAVWCELWSELGALERQNSALNLDAKACVVEAWSLARRAAEQARGGD